MIVQRTDMTQRPAVAGVGARLASTPPTSVRRPRTAVFALTGAQTRTTTANPGFIPTQHRRPSIE